MSFLTPLFFVALAGLAVPVIIHLIQKERKSVVAFPSLMFLRRIPYQSVNRRRIRNWPLLLLRLAAIALVVSAFARPFFRGGNIAAAAAGGSREVVILLDRSYSLDYGDRWQRAAAAAKDAVGRLSAGDRASLVLFDIGAEVLLRSAGDKARLAAAIDGARPGAAATKYGPALKLAGSILSESSLPNREVVVISDFQRLGWFGAEGVRLPEGTKVTPVAVHDAQDDNVSVTPAVLRRTMFSGQERVSVTAGAVNRGNRPVSVNVALEIDGRVVETKPLTLEAHGSGSTTFNAFTPAAKFTRGTVRLGEDALATDNNYHFVVSPRERVTLLIVERTGTSRAASLYLAQALALSESPAFEVVRRPMDRVSAEDVSGAAVIVLNDVPVGQVLAERLTAFTERGGGLFAAFGERGTWPGAISAIMPVAVGAATDRTRGTPGRIGTVDYGHAVFESFRSPRSGDFSTARFYNYRTVTLEPGAQVLARFDDGAPALIERRVSRGRVMAWTSSLDVAWNDLALKPVFLPFIHRVASTLASYARRPEAFEVGEAAAAPRSSLVVTPSGRRIEPSDKDTAIELYEQGFYELRPAETGEEPIVIASNVDLAESDMTPMDPQEVAAGATGRASGTAGPQHSTVFSDEERERSQRLWWYLLFAGLLLFGMEPLIANAVKTRYR